MPKERTIAIVDIGSSKICTIIANVSEDRISVIGVSNVQSKGIKKSVVVDIDDAVESISQSIERAERMAGHSISSAYVTVGGSHIESANSHGVVAVSHKDAEIGEEDVCRVTEAAQALSLPSNREIIHVIPRDFMVDKQDGVKDPVGMSGIRLEVEVNIIHGAATAMKNLTKCVNQVGVEVFDFIYTALAASEAVLTDTEKELGTILVDIGGGTTSLIIFSEGSPAYSAVLPVGGQNITNDLAIGLRESLENAEKIKLRLSSAEAELKRTTYPQSVRGGARDKEELMNDLDQKGELDISDLGLDSKTVSRKLLRDIIRERLREMFSYVGMEIKKANYIGKLPAGIVLTGGGAQTYGIERVAREVLRMPVRIGYPKGVSGLIDEIGSPAFAASVGSVIYSSRAAKSSASFSFKAKDRVVVGFGKVVSWLKSFLP